MSWTDMLERAARYEAWRRCLAGRAEAAFVAGAQWEHDRSPRLFDLLEALADGLAAVDRDLANDLRAGFARGTGGAAQEFIVKRLVEVATKAGQLAEIRAAVANLSARLAYIGELGSPEEQAAVARVGDELSAPARAGK